MASGTVFAQKDVFIDLNGNIDTGAVAQGRLEVQGDTDRDGIVGITDGSGAAIHGVNPGGQAGFFDGNVEVTGSLNVQGSISGESDPKVGTLSAGQWCTTDGNQVNCTSNAPSGGGAESDPFFTAWDRNEGIFIFESQISDLNHFTSLDETDPKVGLLSAGKWCNSNGSQVICNSDGIPASEINSGSSVQGDFSVVGSINTFGGYKINNEIVFSFPALNTFVGISAGTVNTGSANTFVGYNAGRDNLTGGNNTFIGDQAGRSNTGGFYNTFIGNQAGQAVTLYSSGNTFIGANAGLNNNGDSNVFIGYNAGQYNSGYNNIFIGSYAGPTGPIDGSSNQLYIDNSSTDTPLIHGDFVTNIITINGDSTITGTLDAASTTTDTLDATTTTTDTLNATTTISDIVKLNPTASAPQTCTPGNAGAIYHDSTTPSLCWCNGSIWVNISGVDNNLCQ